MAYVFQRDGKWFMGWTDAGRTPRRAIAPEQTKKAALARAHELEHLAKLQRMGLETRTSEVHTWDELIPRYETEVVPTLASSVRSILRTHVAGAFRGRALLEISEGDAIAFINRLRGKDLKDSSRAQVKIRCSAVFTFAQQLGWVPKGFNPFSAARVKVPKKRPKYLEVEEVRAMLRACDGETRNLLAATVFLGMRRGEVAGLLWEDVDLPRYIVHVRHSYDGPTKSAKERPVAVSYELMPFLVDQKRRTGEGRHVFPGPNGKPLTLKWDATKIFRDTLRAAGVERGDLTFRALRSTYGTHFAAQTGDLSAVQDALGHSTPIITRQHYAAAIPEHRIQQGQRFSFGLTPGELPSLRREEQRPPPAPEKAS